MITAVPGLRTFGERRGEVFIICNLKDYKCMITLSAKPSSDLKWEKSSDSEGIYHLDFGWPQLDPYNPALFNANLLAVEEFAKQFPEAKKVILAISSGQFESIFSFSEMLEDRAKESPLSF